MTVEVQLTLTGCKCEVCDWEGFTTSFSGGYNPTLKKSYIAWGIHPELYGNAHPSAAFDAYL